MMKEVLEERAYTCRMLKNISAKFGNKVLRKRILNVPMLVANTGDM